MKKAASIFFCSVAWAFGIQAQEIEKPAAERVAVLQDKRINESSGLTRSLKHSGVFWTLNDSSSAPCVFAIDEKGQTRAKVRIPGAVNFDWEDLACAKDAQGIPHLFIGDLGDNLSVRPTVTVYEVTEPDLPQNADKEQLSAAPKLWHATYPDGRHNAETLLVHPKTRRIYIVTKTEHGHSALYAFPEKPVQGATLELVKLTDLEFPPRRRLGKRPQDACQTTGGAFSPDHLLPCRWRLSATEKTVQRSGSPASVCPHRSGS